MVSYGYIFERVGRARCSICGRMRICKRRIPMRLVSWRARVEIRAFEILQVLPWLYELQTPLTQLTVFYCDIVLSCDTSLSWRTPFYWRAREQATLGVAIIFCVTTYRCVLARIRCVMARPTTHIGTLRIDLLASQYSTNETRIHFNLSKPPYISNVTTTSMIRFTAQNTRLNIEDVCRTPHYILQSLLNDEPQNPTQFQRNRF